MQAGAAIATKSRCWAVCPGGVWYVTYQEPEGRFPRTEFYNPCHADQFCARKNKERRSLRRLVGVVLAIAAIVVTAITGMSIAA